MTLTLLDIARALPDKELLARVQSLTTGERALTAELIAHLAELETRGLHLAASYGSMFSYCRRVLHLSEHEAYHRIVAARTARLFPTVLDLLAQGALNLTSVKLLAPHLTPENHVEVLASARGLSRRQVEKLVARLEPAPDVPCTIRKWPAPKPDPPAPPQPPPATVVTMDSAAGSPPSPAWPAPADPVVTVPAPPPPTSPQRAMVTALSPQRYKMQLTISEEILQKLELAKDLLRHAIPAGNEEVLFERALDALLADLIKKKLAVTDRPRRSSGVAAGSRDVPAEVKRAVYLRDGGRCAFIGDTGRRCGERAFVEFHHLDPYAHGGPPTVSNIQLRCGPHNRHAWKRESAQHERAQLEGP